MALIAGVLATRDGDGEGDGPTGPSGPRGNGGSGAAVPFDPIGAVHEFGVDESGGTFTVADAGDPLTGIRLTVPAGALSGPAELSLQAAQLQDDLVAGDLLASSPPAVDSLAVAVQIEVEADSATHPVLGLIHALDTAELVGPAVLFEPSGTDFDAGVTVELPAAFVGDSPESLMFLVGDGKRVEVAQAAPTGDGGMAVTVDHFSFLQTIKSQVADLADLAVWVGSGALNTIRKGARNIPDLIEYRLGFGPVNAALETLPTAADFLEAFGRGAACTGVHVGDVTLPGVPDQWTLLKWLGWHAAADERLRRPAAEAALTALFEARAREVQAGAAQALNPADIFRAALEATEGDLFGALIASHNALYAHRQRLRPGKALAGALAPIRGDGGDETGAYYHLFGMATFALTSSAIESTYATGTGRPYDVEGGVTAEFAATMEEALFASDSGDVSGDPTEYAVDLVGARLGKALYLSLRNQRRGALERDYGVAPRDCAEGVPGSGGTGYYAIIVDDPGIVSVRGTDVTDAGGLEMCGFRHGGRDCRAASVTKLSDEPFPDTESATRFICEQLSRGSFRSPPLAEGWVADLAGRSVTVDDWGDLDIGLCRSIVNGEDPAG